MDNNFVCVKCSIDKTDEANHGLGNCFRPESFKNTLPWLEKEFYLCAKCLSIILIDWIYEHINKNGELI